VTKAAALRTLIALSRRLGRDRLLAQAGGGNISVKAGAGSMLIKASGSRLEDVNEKSGWVEADAKALRAGLPKLARLKDAVARELGYATLIGRAARGPGGRPSMEAGFHAVIPDACVAHVHSAAGIVLAMRPEKEALRRARAAAGPGVEVRCLPACVPGLELTRLVSKSLPRGRARGAVSLWLLRNHGLIWAAGTAEALLAASDRFERALRAELNLDAYEPPHAAGARGCSRRPASDGWTELCVCSWPKARLDAEPLFPDFAIYFHSLDGKLQGLKAGGRALSVGGLSPKQRRDRAEVYYLHALTATLAKPRLALPRALALTIRGLETERLRLAQAGVR
jgi:ribulose-5-phosphate 4-epimerase/fuculose-1-phosphate aldolase